MRKISHKTLHTTARIGIFVLFTLSAMVGCTGDESGNVEATAGTRARFVYPSEWSAPSGAVSPPGDGFTPDENVVSPEIEPAAGAPEVAEWNRTAHPDESFTMTGVRFTALKGDEAGNDTEVWITAFTPDGMTERRLELWNVEENLLTATIPEDIPYGMYLLWVKNNSGVSRPVVLNRAMPQWIGPLGHSQEAGETARVFGRNLATDHDSGVSHVFIQKDGQEEFISCETGTVEPYSVEFTLPDDLPDGNYELYVHNGHGGGYGFGGPVRIQVSSGWQRGTGAVELEPSEDDYTAAFQEAFAELKELPEGGTLQLSGGTYHLDDTITVPEKIRVAGEGKDETEIRGGGLLPDGEHVAVERLTLRGSSVATVHDSYNPHLHIRHVRFLSDDGSRAGGLGVRDGLGFKLAHCELGHLQLMGVGDAWIHNNRFTGVSYGPEAGITFSGGGIRMREELRNEQIVIEHNHFETPDWPVGPDGSRNYRDFLFGDELQSTAWVKRVINTSLHRGSINSMYLAHNTSKDVAVQDNKGEMILLHEGRGSWFGHVLEVEEGTTLRLRTDRGIDDAPNKIVRGASAEFKAGGEVPTRMGAGNSGYTANQAYATVIKGPGLGQVRRVVSHTEDSVELESPFRVTPMTESVVLLQYLYKDNIIYNNQLNAFPEGYDLRQHTASTGIQIGGGGFRNVAEGNVSRRTSGSRMISGRPISPSYWNEFRDEVALDSFGHGFQFTMWRNSPFAAATIGNAYRGGHVELQGNGRLLFSNAWFSGEGTEPRSPGVTEPLVLAGNIFEHIKAVGGTDPQLRTRGTGAAIREMPLCSTLFRRNEVRIEQPFVPRESISLSDFELSFRFRLPEVPETDQRILSLHLGIGTYSLRAEGEQEVISLGESPRIPLNTEWHSVVFRREGNSMTVALDETATELSVSESAVDGVRLRIQNPYYFADFRLSDGEGDVVFEDTFRDYPRGRISGGIFTQRGWEGHMWGDVEVDRDNPPEKEFLIRGHDFRFGSTGGYGMRALNLSDNSRPMLSENVFHGVEEPEEE